MIKINLAPEEELENHFWWVPLVIAVVVLFFVSKFAVQMYLDDLRTQIVSIQAETEEHNRGFEELKSKQDEFKARDAEREDLENRLAALQRITESKILRYRPVILLEHLQNLKPEGIWFNRVSLLKTVAEQDPQAAGNGAVQEQTPEALAAAAAAEAAKTADGAAPQQNLIARINKEADQHEITITGRAFDNILVAEFLSALKSTQSQEVDPTSLRTMVYFSEIQLKQTSKTTEQLVDNVLAPNLANAVQGAAAQTGLPNQPGVQTPAAAAPRPVKGEIVTEFEITLKFREHPTPIKNQAMQTFSFMPDHNKRFTMY